MKERIIWTESYTAMFMWLYATLTWLDTGAVINANTLLDQIEETVERFVSMVTITATKTQKDEIHGLNGQFAADMDALRHPLEYPRITPSEVLDETRKTIKQLETLVRKYSRGGGK